MKHCTAAPSLNCCFDTVLKKRRCPVLHTWELELHHGSGSDPRLSTFCVAYHRSVLVLLNVLLIWAAGHGQNLKDAPFLQFVFRKSNLRLV
jgi:hypothetical protein